MDRVIIDSISKSFYSSFKSIMIGGFKELFSIYFGKNILKMNKNHVVEVFNDFSIKIAEGEMVLIRGENGRGKTTLLKMISGIIAPDAGKIKLNGRCFPLFYRGGGFRLLLSGRENIYFSGKLFGLSKRQINLIIDKIIDFSGLRKEIDRPLRTYSDGMYARLLISFAIYSGFEIILVDELLSVCDKEFRKKAFTEFQSLLENNVSFVIVSHNEDSIESVFSKIVEI